MVGIRPATRSDRRVVQADARFAHHQIPTRCWALLEELFELPYEFKERNTEDATNLAQLEQVQSTRSCLVVADERLRLAECVCKINLTKTGLDPKLTEQS